MNKCLVVSGCITFWILVIIGIVLFACSFSILELDEYGIIFDNNDQSVEDEPHNSGRYFTGLGRKFIIFPRELQTIEFSEQENSQGNSLSCFTKDGLSVWLDISLHFKLERDQLKNLHYQFGDEWYSSLVRITASTVKDISTIFHTNQFFDNRVDISNEISKELQTRYDKYTKKAVKVDNLQLRQIKFDEKYEEAIVEKLISEQIVTTTEIIKNIKILQKNMTYTNVTANNQIQRIYADVEAEGNKKKEQSRGTAFKDIITGITGAYKKLFEDLEVELLAEHGAGSSHKEFSTEEKLQYIYVNELTSIQNSKTQIYVGVDKPFITRS